MIDILQGDITKFSAHAIVNPANGIGVMGAGAAGAIRDAAGWDIQNEAKEIVDKNGNPIEAGNFYVTSSGDLISNGVTRIYHAVTMTYPGGPTSLHIVSNVWKAVLQDAKQKGIASIASPGLGIGIGGLDKSSVARIMVKIARNFIDMNIFIVDNNPQFLAKGREMLEME